MRRLTVLTSLLISCLLSTAQKPVGTWTDHLSYNAARRIAFGNQEIFASTESAIIIYDTKYSEVRKLSKVNGLTESGISTIDFSKETSTLIIGYSSTNIDLVKDNVIYNLPDIKLKYLPGEKVINRIHSKGRYAYIACSFGIVVIDINAREIYDTWKPGSANGTSEVFDLTFKDDIIYATTANGVFFANSANQGLSYYGNWTRVDQLPDPSASFSSIVVSNNRIYVNRSQEFAEGDSVYVISNGCSLFSYEKGVFYKSFDSFQAGFIFTTTTEIKIFNVNGLLTNKIDSYSWGKPEFFHSMIDGNKIWIADNNHGLVEGDNFTSFISQVPNGPFTNNATSISQGNGKIFIAGGGVNNAWNNQWRTGQIFSYSDNLWSSELNDKVKDIIRVLPEPGNNTHFFAASWGGRAS